MARFQHGKCFFIIENLTDFRTMLEAGVDPRVGKWKCQRMFLLSFLFPITCVTSQNKAGLCLLNWLYSFFPIFFSL